MLTLVRKDEPEYKIELIRWHEHIHGWWGYTQQMVINHRTPCLFPNRVWQIEPSTPGE
jgi:hypothetical protein